MALAFDASAQKLNNNVSSDSWTHTCTGTDLILFVMVASNSVQTSDTATYNGVSMTKIAEVTVNSRTNALWVLINPATGANTVAVTWSGSAANTRCASASYTATKQSAQPDSSHGVNNSTGSVATTVVASGCWLIGAFYDGDLSAITGSQTTRETLDTYALLEDSNGTVGTGSQSLSVTGSGSNLLGIVASIAPFFVPVPLNVDVTNSLVQGVKIIG